MLHLDDSLARLLGTSISALVALAGVFVARAGYHLAKTQREDQWIRTFAELHKEFWNEYPYGIVRGWLACDADFEQLRPVLEKRRDRPHELTSDDYKSLEKLDKFLNLLSRAAHVAPSFSKEGNLWTDLFFHYWLQECKKPSRQALHWYLDEFYEGLQAKAMPLAPGGKPRSPRGGA